MIQIGQFSPSGFAASLPMISQGSSSSIKTSATGCPLYLRISFPSRPMYERLLLTKHLTIKSGSMPAPTTFASLPKIATSRSVADSTERHRKSFGFGTATHLYKRTS